MDVLYLNPSFPPEMALFARGLAQAGARVFGVGDGPQESLPQAAKGALSGYLRVPRLLDEADVERRVLAWLGGRRPDRVECQWEPLVLVAARLRERLGLPGMNEAVVAGFRDKPLMRARVAAAGLRIPRTCRAANGEEVWAAARITGFPLIIKPVAGAGSADTFRVDSPEELGALIGRGLHPGELSVEEFITGMEYTYETICVDGRPVYESVSHYRPSCLVARQNEWISPIIQSERDLSAPHLQGGIELGRSVLSALGMQTGFTHMEWFLTPAGEAIFGEVACRPPGANMVDLMNYTGDCDLYLEWGRAVVSGRIGACNARPYSAAIIFKRAQGQGRIWGSSGLDAFRAKYGSFIAREDWLSVGSPRRDWTQTFLSDGNLVVRHPDPRETAQMADEAAASIALYARP